MLPWGSKRTACYHREARELHVTTGKLENCTLPWGS